MINENDKISNNSVDGKNVRITVKAFDNLKELQYRKTQLGIRMPLGAIVGELVEKALNV